MYVGEGGRPLVEGEEGWEGESMVRLVVKKSIEDGFPVETVQQRTPIRDTFSLARGSLSIYTGPLYLSKTHGCFAILPQESPIAVDGIDLPHSAYNITAVVGVVLWKVHIEKFISIETNPTLQLEDLVPEQTPGVSFSRPLPTITAPVDECTFTPSPSGHGVWSVSAGGYVAFVTGTPSRQPLVLDISPSGFTVSY